MSSWLVLDATYLCHRLFHAMGDLSFDDRPTGVVFGFLRDLVSLRELHPVDHIAFCFDDGISLRRKRLPQYKSTRQKKREQSTKEEKRAYRGLQEQIELLREEHLPKIGYRNIYSQKGYEADDLIAEFRKTINRKSIMIIVSSDQDLYQLLGSRTSIWNPSSSKLITLDSFREEWGIEPAQWVDVKAIAGCSTDDIPGIRGVGEKTATKFLRNKLKPTTKAYQSIVRDDNRWRENVELVELPYPGVGPLKLRKDQVTRKKFNQVCRGLGIRSLV